MKKFLNKVIPNQVLNKIRAIRTGGKYVDPSEYKGNNVCCPICGSEYSEFAPYGVKNRRNARCHNCKSMERHRLLYLYLKNKLNLLQSTSQVDLLHFAPEKVFYNLFSVQSNINYTPCDLNPDLYDFDGPVEVQKVDITKIPFENDWFDLILCNHVLEHIPDDRKAMKELFRVMKKGGHGIFQVPIKYELKETYEDWSITSEPEREKAFGQKDHVRWYGSDYPERLSSVGFTVDEDEYVKTLDQQIVKRYALSPYEIIYHCIKP